jgi:hypothetical protein
MLFLIHTQPNTAVKSSVLHLFISYDSLCHATASWSKGIIFGVESLVSNTSPCPRGMSVCVLVIHIRENAGNQRYPCYRSAVWNSGRGTGSVLSAKF